MVTFAELAARGSLLINDGYRTKQSELGDPGFPVLRVAEVGDGWITPTYGDHVRREFKDKIGIKLSRAGDVLLTTKGTVGRRTIMPALDVEFAYSPQLCFFRVLDDTVDFRWLYYWLASSEFWDQATGVSQQTDMAPYISLRDLRAIRVDIPPIATQRSIAKTLGALDEKIESNRRAAGLILSLLEGKLMSAVSEGAESLTLDEVATFHNRRRVPLSRQQREQKAGNYPYYGATGIFGYVDDFLFDDILTLVGEDGSVVNDDGTPVTQYIWGKSWINNHAHPLTGNGISTDLLFLALRSVDVRPIITGAVQAKISMTNLKTVRLRLPSSRPRGIFESVAKPLFNVYRQKLDEVEQLIALRDALLPELLSGAIRAPKLGEVTQYETEESVGA